MAAAGTSADLISLNSPEIESAWHILSVLIGQGCAAQLPELASRSGLPQNLIELLSRIPGFPLTVTTGEFIHTSGAAGEEFTEFVTGTANLHVPRDVFTFLGLRRGSLNVSVKYARKRKAGALSSDAVFLTSSKRRPLLTHKRGKGESTKNKGVPSLFPSSNEISRKVTFDVTNSLDGEQHLVGTGPLDGFGQLYDFSMPLHELIFFDFGNISCMSEDARASGPFTKSVVPHNNVLDLSYDHAFIDVGLNGNIVEEHAFQRQEVVEHDFRPHLDGMLNQPLPVNQILGEDCNTLSLELGFFDGIPEVQALERLTLIEKDFEVSLTKQVSDDDALMDHIDHYSQNGLMLACRKQPVTEVSDDRKMHSKDDKLITAQLDSNEMIVDSMPSYCQRKDTSTFDYAFGDVANNSPAVGLALMSDSADVSEEKQRSSKPSTNDDISLAGLQNVVGSNFASIITSFTEKRVKNVENSSEQKLIPCFESFITEKEEASGIYLGGCGTAYKAQRKEDGNNVAVIDEAEHMKVEGVSKLSPFSTEIIMKSPPKKKLMPNFEFFIKQNKNVSGKEEPVKKEGLPKLLPISNQIPRKVNFDVPSPSDNEQHSAGMDTLDCSTGGLHLEYIFPAPLHDFSYFESRNVSYIKEEDTRESATYVSNSVFHNEVVDLSYEDLSLDVVPNANMKKKHAFQRLRAVEPDFRPLLNGVMHQPSVVNLTLGEDCNAIELGFLDSIPQVHAHESLSMIEKNLEESLLEQAWNETELRLIENDAKYPSLLEYRNQLVIEAIDENKIHSTDDKLTTGQLESNENIVNFKFSHCHRKESLMSNFAIGDNAKNSAAIESANMDELAGVSEENQWTFNNPSIKDQVASVGLQNLTRTNLASNSNSSTKDQDRNIEAGLIHHQKVKDICKLNIPSKEKKMDFVTKPSKNFSEKKLLPNFESFIIEEEEGSGGYGTVYKAQRKEDGKIVAVKCPHANAHSHHVNNELKMLERFGGRNFVIKYEGSFKNGDSECFVLEHVEHDRPEVLKKEIGLFELQWYGFCMFKALASLHKQGVVHRDVKPGNFLFSRNVNKGYLIDFNLASDLHMKFCRSSKRKLPSASVNQNPIPESKLLSSLHSRKFIDNGFLGNTMKEAPNESKKVIASKSSKKKSLKDRDDGFPIIEKSKPGSQTADVSGLTSTKDQTSNKSPVDWQNQPIPCKGRKELIKFVHKAMHSTQILKPASNGPSSQRKRVAAPMAPNDTGLLILTPMPLHSGGNAIAGAGLKSKAGGKVKREGPCVGTKGFRAPEVLFKSFHQGCKIDMWSAGVTILYLMIGRAPFGGDPEQNIKEIARLRGSEELWEVAKLHNCETSFPVDLLDVGSLNSMKLRDWCAKNTRRPDFFQVIPESLFDLVDRCLTVNPRCRFSAEEALMHKFFTPCHESIRKQRMLRKVATSDPSSSNS